jgi:hypothetical protein
MYRFVLLSAVVVFVGCGSDGSSANRPIVTLTATEAAREYAADPDAFRSKYAANRLEITGTVDHVSCEDPNEAVVHLKFDVPAGSLAVAFHLSQEGKVLPMVPGQTVKVRGNPSASGAELVDGEVVDAHPPDGMPVATMLAAAKDPDTFKKKYIGMGVKLSGRVGDQPRRKPSATGVMEFVIVLGDEADPEKYVTCRVKTSERADQRYKLISLKRSDKITVVGRITAVDTDKNAKEIVTLDHAFIVPN